MWFLAWVALVPLLWVIDECRFWPGFWRGYLTGVFYFFGMFWWISHVTIPGMILLNLYLAVYFAVFAGGYCALRYMPRWLRLLFAACLWVVCEFLRGRLLSGFGWAALGHSQYRVLPVVQLANLTGLYGISFVVATVNLAVNAALGQVFKKQAGMPRAAYVCVIGLTVFIVGYGYYSLGHIPAPVNTVSVALVQPNVAQEQKWEPAFRRQIMDRLLDLSRQAAEGRPDLIVWPESALPLHAWESPVYFDIAQEFARDEGIPLLLGSVTLEDFQYYNSTQLLSVSGETAQTYHKLHLVPFGEYIPLRRVLSFVESIVPIADMSPGDKPVVFSLDIADASGRYPRVLFSTLICFEDTMDQVARLLVRAGAGFLVNVTNDGWFKGSKAALLHLQASVFQAAAHQRYLVRAANTGVSAVIGPQGKIVNVLSDERGRTVGVQGFLSGEIGVHVHQTAWAKTGNVFVYFCVACLCLGVIINCVFYKSYHI